MSPRGTQVYIVNNSGHRYDLALELFPDATLISMTRGNINPTHVDRHTFNLNEHIARSLESDYLLLSGHPTLNTLAGMLWILRHEVCQMLIFDAKTQEYVRQIVSRDNMRRMIDANLFNQG